MTANQDAEFEVWWMKEPVSDFDGVNAGHVERAWQAACAYQREKDAAELKRLAAENAELRKDAERYWWIRRFPIKAHRLLDIGGRKEKLDSAIDAALQGKEKP